jgi:dolichol kinase
MGDGFQALAWVGILIFGLSVCVALRKAGLPATHVRDLLHVGAGCWVFGWPWWRSGVAPVGITLVAALALLLVPVLAARVSLFAAFQQSVSGGDERWNGLVLYALSFALMTWLAWRSSPFPAAAALLALALGDGIGGAVGRRFGRHFFAVPGGKRKSFEGAAAVAIAAAAGAWIASFYFGAGSKPAVIIGIGVVAAIAEALAPRSSDNLLVPAVVFLFASAVHRCST